MHNSESRVQSHQTQLQSPECVCYGLRNFSVISGSNRSNCKPGFTRNCLVTTKHGSSLFDCDNLLPSNDNRFNKQENACHRQRMVPKSNAPKQTKDPSATVSNALLPFFLLFLPIPFCRCRFASISSKYNTNYNQVHLLKCTKCLIHKSQVTRQLKIKRRTSFVSVTFWCNYVK